MSVVFGNNEDCTISSKAAIDALERKHGIVLPLEYRQFLLSSPGGYPCPRWSSFGADGDFVAHVYGIHEGANWKRLNYAIEQFGHDLSIFLPMAISNGGNYFLLRLIEPDRGGVYFWDHELEAFHPPAFEFLIRISDSFTSWLDGLRKDP